MHPPDEVHDAFRDVASAQEDKLRTINRANIFAVETVNQAKGEAAAMIEQALAFKEQQILHAQGDAASFLLRLSAYRRAPELTKFRLQVETIEADAAGPAEIHPAGRRRDQGFRHVAAAAGRGEPEQINGTRPRSQLSVRSIPRSAPTAHGAAG